MENTEIEIDTSHVDSVMPPKRGGGDKRMQAIREAMDTLIGAVDVDNYNVDEYDVLGRIMVRSGLMWRCIKPSCLCINHLNSTSCDNCGAYKNRVTKISKDDLG